VILQGKRILVTGVISRESIAYAVAEKAQNAGAEVILTSFGRAMRLTERAASRLPHKPDVLELDVNDPEHLERLTADVSDRWDGLDGVLHAIAFAPEDALGGRFMTTPPESALTAFQTSAYSYKALAASLLPLFDGEGSVVGMDFDASVAWPVYDWMGVSKAALESVNRYLARDLGPHGVRVNLVSAGPLETLAARGIPGFRELVDLWQAQAPLGWDPDDRDPVAKTVCWLLSDWSKGVSGEIVHVDGGFHAMGAPSASPQSTVHRPQDAAPNGQVSSTRSAAP
jgi:enoyl-[acyl-carrier protein] reductase I